MLEEKEEGHFHKFRLAKESDVNGTRQWCIGRVLGFRSAIGMITLVPLWKVEYDDGSTEENNAAELAQVLGDAASHDCAGPCIDDVYAGQLTAAPGAQPYVHPVD